LTSFVFQESSTSGLCADMDVEPANGNSVLISSWTIVGTPSGGVTIGELTTSFVGTFTTNWYTENTNNAVTGMRLTCVAASGCSTGATVLLSDDGTCTFSLSFNDGSRKRAGVGGVSGSGVFSLSATSAADPHLRGANGVKYDFNGQPDAIYVLFSSPQFQVTMHLKTDGPESRFMTEIGVTFRNVTMRFDVFIHPDDFVANLNKQLQLVGGRASGPSWAVMLELCSGHTVTISQMRTVEPWLAHANGSPFYYLDVGIVAPGCHDLYDGALGQTYKCKYATGKEKFVWSSAQEESFRIPTLFTLSGSFNPTSSCHDMKTFKGQLPMSGSTAG